MLARQREAFRTQRHQAKQARLAVRRRSALATVKATLRQWRAADDKCNCHDFSCWRELWLLDPPIATFLRASNHHLRGCHMQQTSPADKWDFICAQCGLVSLWPLRNHEPHSLERSGRSTPSSHSSDTGESDEDPSDGRVYRRTPLGHFTHGHRIMPRAHPNLKPIFDDDPAYLRREREQARTAECGCLLPMYGMWSGFFKIGVRSTCKHCSSTIEAGVLYGGYEEKTDRFYWRSLLFTITVVSADCQVRSLGVPVASGWLLSMSRS